MTRHSIRISIAVIGALNVVACDPGELPGARGMPASVDTVGGTVVVSNAEVGAWTADEIWSIEEEYRMGTADVMASQAVLFTNEVIGATMGPLGQVCVMDFPAQELTCFDGDGTNPRRIAGPGPGPGELEWAAGTGWDDDRRFWVSSGKGYDTLFNESGEFIKTVPRPIHGTFRRQYPLIFEDSGTLIDEWPTGSGMQFLRVDRTTGEIVDSLAFVSSIDYGFPRIPLLPGYDDIRVVLDHYRPELRWAVAHDGTFWLARTNELRLYKIDLAAGDTIKTVTTAHRGNPGLSRQDEDLIRRGLAEVGVDRGTVDFTRPMLQGIYVTDDDWVLVHIVEEVGENGRTFDVFNPDGYFMGSITTPFNLPDQSRPDIVGDTIIGISVGEYDEPYVVRATINRPGKDGV